MLHKEFNVDGSSANDTVEVFNSLCEYFIDHPRNIQESIPFSSSHHIDQIKFNDWSMFLDMSRKPNLQSLLRV